MITSTLEYVGLGRKSRSEPMPSTYLSTSVLRIESIRPIKQPRRSFIDCVYSLRGVYLPERGMSP